MGGGTERRTVHVGADKQELGEGGPKEIECVADGLGRDGAAFLSGGHVVQLCGCAA